MQNINTATHKCVSNNNSSGACAFCRVCGVYMSTKSPQTIFHRLAKHCISDPYKLDGNMMLKEMIKRQGANRYYNVQANHLGYRSELLCFVEEISMKLEYSEATFHLAVAVLDALLSLYAIEKKQLKMVCFMALNLAAKMEENNSKIPELCAIVQLFENQFTADELANCEVLLAGVLGYNINIKTPLTFVNYFMSRGVISSDDLISTSAHEINKKLEQFEQLVSFFMHLSITHYDFYKFTSIAVATSVIACARKLIGFETCWNTELENLTHVSQDSIEQCCAMLYEAARDQFPLLTPQAVLGLPLEENECSTYDSAQKSRSSVFTQATSEKDDTANADGFGMSDCEEDEHIGGLQKYMSCSLD